MWKRFDVSWWTLGAIFSLGVAVLILAPVFYLSVRALGVSPAVIAETITSPETARVLLNSVGLAVAVVIFSSFLSFPLAILITKTDLRFRRFWEVAAAMPLVVPSYIGAFALIAFAGPRGSILQRWLAPLGVTELPSIYGWGGAVIVITLFTYPFLYLPLNAAFKSLDPRMFEAARTLGKNKLTAFFKVVFPYLVPVLGAGSLLVALYTLSDFGAVSLLQFDSFTRVIYVEYRFSFDRHLAAFYSLLLVVLTLFILLLENWFRNQLGSRRTADVDARLKTERYSLGLLQIPAQLFMSLIFSLTILLPVAVSGYWVWRGYFSGMLPGFPWQATVNSLGVALLAGIVCLLISLPLAYFINLNSGGLGKLTDRLAYIGYALPGLVVGLALIFLSISHFPLLYQTFALLIIGYTIRFLPLQLEPTVNSLANLNRRLFEAARTLGRGEILIFSKIVLPLIRASLLSGLVLVFLSTMKELPATLLLRPTGFNTLATRIWESTEEAFFARAGLHGLVLIGVTLLVVGIIFYLNPDFIEEEKV